MKCVKCGSEVEKNDSFCSNCGSKLSQENEMIFLEEKLTSNETIMQDKPTNEKNKKFFENPDKVTLLAVILLLNLPGWIITIILKEILSNFSNLSESTLSFLTNVSSALYRFFVLFGLGLLVYTRVKFPKHIASKVVFGMVIILGILYIIFAVWLMVSCFQVLQGCPG